MVIEMFLFGKPEWMIKELSYDVLIDVGEGVRAQMQLAAKAYKILTENGWNAQMGLYDIIYDNEKYKREDLDEYLKNKGLDIKDFSVLDWDEEE